MQRLANAVRTHWEYRERAALGTRCLDENYCRIRQDHAPQNFALLRHIALNLLRPEQSKGEGKGQVQASGVEQ